MDENSVKQPSISNMPVNMRAAAIADKADYTPRAAAFSGPLAVAAVFSATGSDVVSDSRT